MNIFLPYENDIVASVESLDDVRLNKQILETYQLLTLAIKEQQEGQEVKAGHYHHPVYVFYKDNIPFLAYYGYKCCMEYKYRFNKQHKLVKYFVGECSTLIETTAYINHIEINIKEPQYQPYYMEGSKGQPNYIRTTENVSALFQNKLCKKWEQDKSKGREPKWTNRQVPEFYRKEMMKSEN